jgi:hypothetical protein
VTRRFARQLAALSILAVPLACVPDESVGPGQSRVSLEEALAEFTIPALVHAMTAFTGVGAAPPAIVPSACPFQPASESFVCKPIPTTGAASGVTLTQSFTLVSVTGARQSAFDRTTTSLLRTSSTVAGTIVDAASTTTLDGHQELTLAGLLTNRHTINGSSTTRQTMLTNGSSGGPVTGVVTTKFTDVVLPVAPPGAPVAWPLSGAMEIQTTIDTDYPPPTPLPGPVTSRLIVLFSGTSIVDVAITVRGVTHICTTNMALSQGLGCQF